MFTAYPVVLASLWFTVAQDPAPPSSGDWLKREGNEIVLEVKDPAAPNLLDLLRACERTTGPRFYLQHGEEDQLTRERMSSISMRIPADQFFAFVQGVLRAHDFGCALVAEKPELIVRAVRMQGEGLQAIKNSVRYIEPADIEKHAGDQAMLFSSLVPLQYVEPQQATTMLSRFFSNSALEGFASLGATPGQPKGLLVIGYGPTVRGIAELLKRIDVPPAPSKLGVIHCEVWQLDDAELVTRIEELAGREDAGEALAVVREATAGAKRLARFQGPASNQNPAQVSSDWFGAEEKLSTSIELVPSLVEGNVLGISLNLHVKGEGQQSGINARISGTAQLGRGGVKALLSSSQRGATVAFLSLR